MTPARLCHTARLKSGWGEKLAKKEYDYWYNYVEFAESSYNLTPTKPVEVAGQVAEMRYLGVNGSDRFDQIYGYLREREWDNVIRKEEDRSVLQVIQGDEIGETWSGGWENHQAARNPCCV